MKHLNWTRLTDLLGQPRPKTDPTWLMGWFTRHSPSLKPTTDAWGNLHLRVGEPNGLLFMAHTDTVDSVDIGRKRMVTDADHSYLALDADVPQAGFVLGADDGAGCEILCCMAEAGIPGHYLWTADEERGCIGISGILRDNPQFFEGFTHALSFDRKGTQEILTHQCGERGCSDEFATSLGSQLGLLPSPNGVFTDSRELFHVVPECTNLSVGYALAHTSSETLDCVYLDKLVGKLLRVDWKGLPVVRKPQPVSRWDDPFVSVDDIVYANPEFVVGFLESWGLEDELVEEYKRYCQEEADEEEEGGGQWRERLSRECYP